MSRPLPIAPADALDERQARRRAQAAERQRRCREKRRLIRELEQDGTAPMLVAFEPETIAALVRAGHVESADLDDPKRSAEALGIALAEIIGGWVDDWRTE